MKFRLSFKIFSAFLLVTIACIVLMLVAIRYFGNRNFEIYFQQKEMKKLESLSKTLSTYYKEQNGWQRLVESPDAWNLLVRSGWSEIEPNPELKNHFFPLHERPPMDRPDMPMEMNRSDSPPSHPSSDSKPFHFGPPISLFDMQKQWITGADDRFESFSRRLPVIVDEKTVGWLGIKFSPKPVHPIENEFLRKQSLLFYMAGGFGLFISAIIALILSRHFLIPIRRLSEATRALTQRNFKTRIPVKSSDELGDLAKRFNDMASKLEDYEHNQQQWLSDISHELRTPLSVLIGEIEAILDGIRKPDEKSLQSLYEEARHLGKIVNDLHEISLAEFKALSAGSQTVEPLLILRRTLDLFSNRFEQNDMSLTIDIDPTFNPKSRGDADRLVQLYSNLLENALKHAQKPGCLTIRQNCDRDRLKIIFEDTGPGVSEDSLPHLFERLYRADPSRSRSTGGSGLGLAICKTIVESHGGEMHARNGGTGGLEIEVTLPVMTEGRLKTEDQSKKM
jgi:two-component system, OmpR family, sensor histidine kinase BaeS